MKKTRAPSSGNVNSRKSTNLRGSSKVRPLTSHSTERTAGSSTNGKKELTTTARPKTSQALRRKQSTDAESRKHSPNERQNESGQSENIISSAIRKNNTKRPASHVSKRINTERDRSISFGSESSGTLKQHSTKSNKELKVNKSSIKSGGNALGPSSFHPVQRKVAWQSVDTPRKSVDPVNDCDNDEVVEDNFQPPILATEDSESEYDTDLETEPAPAAPKQYDSSGKNTYLKVCKQEDVLPVSSLQPKFEQKEMAITHRSLGSKGTLPLAKSLLKNVYVEKLDLSDNGIEELGASLISSMLGDNCYITQLDLSQNSIGANGGIVLAEMLMRNQILRKLTLRSNHLTDRVAKRFAESLRENRTLWHLDLSHNEIGEQGAVFLGAGLAINYGLKHFDLSWNCIRGKGGVAIAQAMKGNLYKFFVCSHGEHQYQFSFVETLTPIVGHVGYDEEFMLYLSSFGKHFSQIRELAMEILAQMKDLASYLGKLSCTNDSLTTLNLSWNGVSLLGCVALGKFLRRNENLKELDLRNNRIGYLGAQRICPGIAKNASLETLKLGLNPLSDEGVAALLKAVKINKNLKVLSLENVTVSSNAFREIEQLEKNREIKIITGGLGSFKKPKEMPQQMAILLDFVKVNRLRLVDWFFQFDKDHSGDISREEFKTGLKETGLKMTPKQLDTLIEYLDVDNNGKIEYSELLIGRDHTLREQRDLRMAQQKLHNLEDMRARLPTIKGFEPD